jgi:hypothetical protein
MTKRESAKKDSLWLWDGEAEYEGELLTLGEGNLVARVREVRRFRLSTGAPGRPVPRDLLERQRELCRRVSFGQSPAIDLGSLLEVRVDTVQASGDRRFDYVLAGTFAAVADEHLETLSQASTDEAVRYLESRRNGRPTAARGDSATGSLGT